MKKLILIVTISVFSNTALAAHYPYAVLGVGNETCGTFISHIDNGDNIDRDKFLNWAQGFISGINFKAHGSHGKDITTDYIEQLLIKFCKIDQREEFVYAVESLSIELNQ
jgi:hypothetical protein